MHYARSVPISQWSSRQHRSLETCGQQLLPALCFLLIFLCPGISSLHHPVCSKVPSTSLVACGYLLLNLPLQDVPLLDRLPFWGAAGCLNPFQSQLHPAVTSTWRFTATSHAGAGYVSAGAACIPPEQSCLRAARQSWEDPGRWLGAVVLSDRGSRRIPT